MICEPCRERAHAKCESPGCCCGHRGSGIPAFTGQQRHDFMIGLIDRTGRIIPTVPKTTTIRISSATSNGNGTTPK